MGIIYDMVSGETESLPAENNTAAVSDELIPTLAVRELSSGGTDGQLAAFSLHLIRALLRIG